MRVSHYSTEVPSINEYTDGLSDKFSDLFLGHVISGGVHLTGEHDYDSSITMRESAKRAFISINDRELPGIVYMMSMVSKSVSP